MSSRAMAPVAAYSILRSVRCCTGMCQVVKPVIQVVELYTFFCVYIFGPPSNLVLVAETFAFLPDA